MRISEQNAPFHFAKIFFSFNSQLEAATFAEITAAEIIFSISRSLMAPFTNQASKADGGNETP